MTVDTKTVTGRREVRYDDFDQLLADAQRMSGANVRALGNWSAGQIFSHLAKTMNMTVDGSNLRPPILLRVVARVLFKRRFINGPMPAGFKLPAAAARQLVPGETSAADGLAQLRQAVERLRREPQRAVNVLLGPLTREESDRLQLTHAALHMSFLVDEA